MAANDPESMLEFLRGEASSTRMRLVAIACCRRIWHLLSHEASRAAVEIAEKFAHGLATESDRLVASAAAESCCIYVDGESTVGDRLEGFAAEAALCTLFGDHDYPPIPTYATTCAIAAVRAAAEAAAAHAEQNANPHDSERAFVEMYAAESREQCELIREIFGNPFGRPTP